MSDRRSLMVVHAHPDDEVFSTGGIIAKYARAGDRVVVVYGTHGEAGEMHDPDLDPDDATPRLGAIREQEARRACALLGTEDVYFLGYRDSGMKDTEANQDPANFMNAPMDEAVDRLLAIMREMEPDVIVTYDENGGYGHPDHIMTHRVATEAFERARGEPWGPEKLYYSARSREGFRQYVEGLREFGLEIPWVRGDFNFDEYGVPDSMITAVIDVSDVVTLKKSALAIHRTQIRPDFFYLSIPDEALAR
ncbi:MAG TPA: PIG-L family deacetylase, partial [Chloroflexota bacterium]|nr:PIG-L family deacetylase [Chloroflexota bacterium]